MSRWHSNARGFSIYAGLPMHAREVRTSAFGTWLSSQGAKLLHTRSLYEVARWEWPRRYPAGDWPRTCILYRKADGQLTWTLDSASDYRAFMAQPLHKQLAIPKERG